MILNNVEVSILASISLVDACNKEYSSDFIFENVIYCIHNEVNGKNYVGQATNFKNRYISHYQDYKATKDGRISDGRILYRAWIKYGLESFIVYIIDVGEDKESLNKKEEYWIKTLHTSVKDPQCFGYNINTGVNDIYFRGLDNSPKCHSKEALEKGNQTKTERYGHGGFINAFTPEANERRCKTNLERYGTKHGPKLSKEYIDKMVAEKIELYGDPMGICNTLENREKAKKSGCITQCFKSIENNLSIIKNNISTWEQYCEGVVSRYKSTENAKNHLLKIKLNIADLKKDGRWSPKLNKLFGRIENIPIEDIKTRIDNLINERKERSLRKSISAATEGQRLAKIFKFIDKVFNTSNISSWKIFCSTTRFIYGRKLHRTKEHLIRIIDSLSKLKQDSRWTPKHESIFGNLTEADKEKISLLKKGGENLL